MRGGRGMRDRGRGMRDRGWGMRGGWGIWGEETKISSCMPYHYSYPWVLSSVGAPPQCTHTRGVRKLL